jgi:glycosyltransferase involved in cell wall biosynthesis
MRIAIMGTRGIPNAYGGFEQFAQYLALGLVRRKHKVSVYNSHTHPYQEKEWKGVEIIHCKDPEQKLGTAGQFLYDFHCLRDAKKREFDILLHLGYTSDSIWHRLWPRKMVNIVNMDGLEWKRSKYKKQTQSFLKRAEKWAATNADILVSDSTCIQQYLTSQYGKYSHYIPYGADIPENFDDSTPAKWGMENKAYSLVIARMEPENNIQMIIEGYLQSGDKDSLLIIGGLTTAYGQHLFKKYSGDQVKFIGALYDIDQLNDLRFYSKLYFHGHTVGGTNPSLLEAMSCHCTIAAHNNIFNKAVLGKDAYYFSDSNNLQRLFSIHNGNSVTDEWKKANLEKIRDTYSWEKVINAYENVFYDAIKSKHPDEVSVLVQ